MNDIKDEYSDEQYLNGGYFSEDEECTNHSMKIVTTRKEHECSGVAGTKRHTFPAKSRAIYETAIHDKHKHVSNYICLPCADTWLNEINPRRTKA
jgi:hypothetical protein